MIPTPRQLDGAVRMPDGSTHKTIYFPTMEQFAIALPPIAEQRVFATQLSRMAGLNSIAETSLRRSEGLFGSLLVGAFSGELGG